MVKINDVYFSDIYITPEKIAYIQDNKTSNGLEVFAPDDFDEFFRALEMGWDRKNSSYSVLYNKILYRVERSVSIYGIQYCARKMPKSVPPFQSLGYPPEITKHLTSLVNAAGLILIGGPTGSGKTTTISSLLKEYLSMEGGFAYTIEDPTEMPLDGVYHSKAGGLGLCKQTLPPNGNWGEGLRSALRSKPRFIMVGEIRTSECANEVLRAATSGHLVLATVHANNVPDAITAVVKYASGDNMSEELAFDLFSRGMLGVIHQQLIGIKPKRPSISYLFTNPDTTKGDQVRGIIKGGKLNLGTSIEQQMTRLSRGMPIFSEV